MNALFPVLALLALLGAHLLRLPARAGMLGSIAAFLAGLVMVAALIRLASGVTGIGRTTDFDRVVNSAVEQVHSDATPYILFTGASYSRNALDDRQLEVSLRALDRDYRVVNLSLEAASLLERDRHLDAFLDRAGRLPDAVFVEIAADFDFNAAQFFNNSKYSARGIEQFGPTESFWTLKGLAGGACSGLTGCAKDAVLLAGHAGLNLLNVGLVARGERPEAAGTLASYDPQSEPRERVDRIDRTAGLVDVTAAEARSGPQWASGFRALQRARLKARGVGVIGYYFPPVIDAEKRRYAQGLCLGELAGLPCIAPDDPVLLDALDREVWFDADHLLDAGARTYVRWLAVRLDASGALADRDEPIATGTSRQ